MNLQAEVDGEKHEVEIKRDGRKLVARIDDREYEMDVSEPEANVFLFKNDGKVTEVFVSPPGPGGSYATRVGNSELEVVLADTKHLRGSDVAAHAVGGKAEIRTAMPGKVVRILVEQGAGVEKGAGVLVVEAMKMQNEMKSPKDGIITEIRVGEGDTVGAGDILMVVE